MFADLPVAEKKSQPKAVDSNIIRDGCEILRSLFHQGADQVLRDSTQAEAADHDGGAVLDIADGFFGARDEFLHERAALSRRSLINSPSNISPMGHGPKPESALMCPAAPAFSRRLPHAYAISRARLRLSQGSEVLATSTDGNDIFFIGIGRKLCSASG